MERKKINLNQKLFPKNRQYPVLNLYIVVTSLLMIIGKLLNFQFLSYLQPLPIILMIKYIYNKGKGKNFLVIQLTQYSLIVVLVTSIAAIFEDQGSNSLIFILKICSHGIFCLQLLIEWKIRQLKQQYKKIRILCYIAIFAVTCASIWLLWQNITSKLSLTILLLIMSIQLCICLKRYESTENSSFYFSLYGTLMIYCSQILNLFFKNIFITGVIQLFYYFGYYLLMHGTIHQSLLQQEINKQIQIDRRNKNN